MSEYKITVEDEFCPEDIQTVSGALEDHNASQTGWNLKPLGVFVRSDDGELVGGVYGWTIFDWLHLNGLWVREDQRGNGHASNMVAAVHEAAIKRGCRYAGFGTFSFQAPKFWAAQGYSVVAEMPISSEHTWYLLKKEFK